MTSYAIWIVPPPDAFKLLEETITALSRSYGAPLFEPHVTLLGVPGGSEKELCARTSVLANQLRPYEVQLTTPGYQDHHFRCLFLGVQETSQVLEANRMAKELFNRKDDPPYMPHLSLLYGNYSAALKEQIIATLDETLRVRFRVTSLHLIRALSDDPRTWSRVQEFPLHAPSES